jgi:type VI secretion system secreted protein VgrG
MMNFIETASAAATDSLDSFAAYASDTRLYEFTLRDSDDLAPWLDHGGLLVAAFVSQDSLHQVAHTDLLVLSRRPDLPLTRLTTRIATLHISQADASRTHITGLISQAEYLGSDGGLTRYRIRMTPWPDMLDQITHSRVWQEQPVNAIIDSIFADYAPHAHWQWSSDTEPVLRQLPVRSYCVQYRETDLDFVSRLLAEDGFSWRIDQDAPNAPSGHSLVIFADSTQTDACPANPDNGVSGLRYAGTGSQQQTDSITRLAVAHSLQPARLTLASFDYKAKAVGSASTPSDIGLGGKYYSQLPPVEHYDHPGQYAFTDRTDADRQAVLRMQAFETRQQRWQGQSTVRSLRAGQRFNIDGNPRPGTAAAPGALIATQVIQLGINNLPNAAGNQLARSFGPLTGWLRDTLCGPQQDGNAPTSPADTAPAEPGKLVATAQRLGYANAFTAIDAARPWRAQISPRLHDPSAADGSQTARIVGFDSNTDATAAQPGDDEICCDALGRVRIRFHWQDPLDTSGSRASCWVRVAQQSAGGGMGSQFLPRIGQEVQVQFCEDDIDRPIVIGAHYNGQGEAGTPATPGGALVDPDTSAYAQASDTSPSAQSNLTNGNAPAWHGAGSDPDTHNNVAAQWGIRSREYSGTGYNQLVFDDSDNQGRIQLKTTQSGTELSLGHLIHSADNHRGSYRGQGIELRTDAWGALRAGAGWLITSYGINHSASQRQTAGDIPASYGLLNTADTLGKSLSQLADSHQSVGIAALKGSYKAAASTLNASAAPIPALAKVMQGMVDGKQLDSAQSDAAAQNTQVTDQHLPHHTDPIISIMAKNDMSLTARQSLQLNAGETLNILNAADSQYTTGGLFRIHSGQAIGLTAGGMKRNATAGIQLIAAQGDTTIQAHNDSISLKAKANLDIKSAHANIDLAAATSITLRTAGGAGITITGGNITAACPGKLTVQAGQHEMAGGTSLNYALVTLPDAKWMNKQSVRFCFEGSDELVTDMALVGKPYKIVDADGGVLAAGNISKDGRMPRIMADSNKVLNIEIGQNKWQKSLIEVSSINENELTNDDIPVEYDPYMSLLQKDQNEAILNEDQLVALVGNVQGEA